MMGIDYLGVVGVYQGGVRYLFQEIFEVDGKGNGFGIGYDFYGVFFGFYLMDVGDFYVYVVVVLLYEEEILSGVQGVVVVGGSWYRWYNGGMVVVESGKGCI